MRSIFTLFLISFSYAGLENLANEMVLEWAISENDVTFSLSAPQNNVSSSGWWGICIKQHESTFTGMAGSDCTYVLKENQQIVDAYASQNGRPAQDTLQNFTQEAFEISNEEYRATWRRQLNTGDSNDVIYTVGNVYDVLWAKGAVNLETIQKHAENDRGNEKFTFTQDYNDSTNDDKEDDDIGTYYTFFAIFLSIMTLVQLI